MRASRARATPRLCRASACPVLRDHLGPSRRGALDVALAKSRVPEVVAGVLGDLGADRRLERACRLCVLAGPVLRHPAPIRIAEGLRRLRVAAFPEEPRAFLLGRLEPAGDRRRGGEGEKPGSPAHSAPGRVVAAPDVGTAGAARAPPDRSATRRARATRECARRRPLRAWAPRGSRARRRGRRRRDRRQSRTRRRSGWRASGSAALRRDTTGAPMRSGRAPPRGPGTGPPSGVPTPSTCRRMPCSRSCVISASSSRSGSHRRTRAGRSGCRRRAGCRAAGERARSRATGGCPAADQIGGQGRQRATHGVHVVGDRRHHVRHGGEGDQADPYAVGAVSRSSISCRARARREGVASAVSIEREMSSSTTRYGAGREHLHLRIVPARAGEGDDDQHPGHGPGDDARPEADAARGRLAAQVWQQVGIGVVALALRGGHAAPHAVLPSAISGTSSSASSQAGRGEVQTFRHATPRAAAARREAGRARAARAARARAASGTAGAEPARCASPPHSSRAR